MKGTTNSQRGTGGGGEKLVISLKTNQASHEDLIGAKFSVVINGNATEYTWQGASMTIDVTPMLNYTVEFGDVEGYAKPEPITHTAVDGNDRFVTGTYNTELVTVNVSAEEGEVSGYEIQIISDGNVLYTQTTSSASYKIPYNTSYTIKASGISGYTTPSEQSFTASQPARNVDVVYKVIPFGVYIYDIDGNLTLPELWNTANNNKAVGVAIIADNCRFVVAKEDVSSSYVYWGGYGTDISTLTSYTSESNAATDFDGVNNTAKIITAIGNTSDGHRTGTAAGDCAAYTFPNGKTGYLGAAGEWQVARQNKEDLNSALTLIGGTTMKETAYWTSTMLNRDYAWRQWFDSDSYLISDRKGNGYYVRAFAPYIANPVFINFTIMTDGVNPESCVCRAGMTWGEWANSGYNTTLYYVSGTQIVQDYKGAHFQVRDNRVAVSTTDVIKEITYYAPFV